MFYVLTARANGDALGEFDSLEAAEAALARIVSSDPSAAEDVGIVAFDESSCASSPDERRKRPGAWRLRR